MRLHQVELLDPAEAVSELHDPGEAVSELDDPGEHVSRLSEEESDDCSEWSERVGTVREELGQAGDTDQLSQFDWRGERVQVLHIVTVTHTIIL